jgi:hypothetical protein
VYEPPSHGYYNAWQDLNSGEQEAAEVYALSKMLLCIFEGVSVAANIMLNSFIFEPECEFPESKASLQLRSPYLSYSLAFPDIYNPRIDSNIAIKELIVMLDEGSNKFSHPLALHA